MNWDNVTYDVIKLNEKVRVRYVYDQDYDPAESWGLPEPEQSQVVAEERAKLEAGELVALGCLVERRCGCCGQWDSVDSLWGIVVTHDDDLEYLALDQMDIPK